MFMRHVAIMGRYTLIITEKPDAALRIASALDRNEEPEKMRENGMPYYVAKRDGEIVVVPALGHLYTVAEARTGKRSYPVFDFRWVPRHAVEKGAKHVEKWLEAIARLARAAETFVDACLGAVPQPWLEIWVAC